LVTVGPHLIEVLVLKADGALTVHADPLGEEDHAVDTASGGEDVDGHAGAGGFGPRDLETVFVELDQVDLLVFNPSASTCPEWMR
jgi:hypothetical protein